MNITILIDLLPDSVKADVIDFNDVLLKNRKNAIRVMMDRILTEEEKQEMICLLKECKQQISHLPLKRRLILFLIYALW